MAGTSNNNEVIEHLERFGANIRAFLKLESASGPLLVAALAIAMVVKNSSLADLYKPFLMVSGEVRVGALSVEKPLFLWVNDGHVAVFSFSSEWN